MSNQATSFQLVDIGSIALSGNKTVVIPIPNMTGKVFVKVSAKYAAVAGTSGLAYTVDYYNGTAYVASAVAGATVAPAATVLGSNVFEYGVNDVTRKDAGTVTAIEVLLTNVDATNAVTYCVEANFL